TAKPEVKPAERRSAEPPEVKPPAVKPEMKPTETKPPGVKPDVKQAETKPPEPKPALTPASVHVLFGQVGAELVALKNAKGVAASDDLWTQYRSITINRDAAPPYTEHTAALLYKLRAAAKERMH